MRAVLRRWRVPVFFLVMFVGLILLDVLSGHLEADTVAWSSKTAGVASILFAVVPAPGRRDPTSPRALAVTLTILLVAVPVWVFLVDLVFSSGKSLDSSATSAGTAGLVASAFGAVAWWVDRRRPLRDGSQQWPITAG